jgi:hypothetical protein
MPRKGTDRCGCGYAMWKVIRVNEGSVRLQCKNCGVKKTTRSINEIRRARSALVAARPV